MEVAVLGAVVSVIGKKLSNVLDQKAVQAQARARARAQALPEEMSLNSYALLQAYVLMAVTGLGYLALTWSTVVLLGGFVTSLGKKDFWCLTVVSMVQAARIFNDSGDNLFPIFRKLMRKLVRKVSANPVEGFIQKLYQRHPTGHGTFTVLWAQVVLIIVQILSMPALVVVLIAGILYVVGPVTCIALSLWRLRQHDYGETVGEDSKANLVPALIIFYCLVIFQGVLFFLWWLIDCAAIWVVVSLREECQLPEKWGSTTVVDYLYDTRAKCWRDPTSIDGRNLINYAVDLVDSRSQKDYLSGARMLDTFIKLKVDVRSLLLPSRSKIQKLIDTLGWRSSNRELREVAARIVAYLAGDVHLSQFPGATQCISSLLDTTLPYWNNQQGHNHHSPFSKSEKDTGGAKGRLIFVVKGIEKYRAKNVRNQGVDIQQDGVGSSTHGSKRDCWNELILQGLTILERLAFDQHNCSDIGNTNDLLPKLIAPLRSKTLTQDINVSAWANVVNGLLKVVLRLVRVPNWIGRDYLVREISRNQPLSNLESFLDHGNNAGTELQMRAIEILTELAFDSSANLSIETKENLTKKQLQLFVDGYKGGKVASKKKERENEMIRVTAGKSLALLSEMKTISMFIMKERENIVDRLTGILDAMKTMIDGFNEILDSKNIDLLNEILDAKNYITYRTAALEILKNLCTHCTLDNNYVKESLLPKVLTEVLATASTPDHPKEQRKNSSWVGLLPYLANVTNAIFGTKKHEENQAISGPGDDEENQATSASGDDQGNRSISVSRSDKKNKSISTSGDGAESHAIFGSGDDEEKQLLSECSGQIKSPDQTNEELKARMEFQEALLSLTFVMCDKLIRAGDFDDVAQKNSLKVGEFVGKLKTIIEENCEARADCLRVVKLCGQILVLMKHSQDTAQFKECVNLLQKASEIMSSLESCMLFAGTDCGVKKTARPLLSDLVEKAQELVGN